MLVLIIILKLTKLQCLTNFYLILIFSKIAKKLPFFLKIRKIALVTVKATFYETKKKCIINYVKDTKIRHLEAKFKNRVDRCNWRNKKNMISK